MRKDLSWLGARLAIDGDFVVAVPFGNGHINDTFAATYIGARGPESGDTRYIHQRINADIFEDPVGLMGNVARVTGHLRRKLEQQDVDDVGRRVLQLVPTIDGADFVVDDEGAYWRTYRFIEGATTHDVVSTVEQAFQVARAFGEFQRLLIDLDPPPLNTTISNFHNTPLRLAAFEDAVCRDPRNRAAKAAGEIAALGEYASMADSLRCLHDAGAIPRRVTHNDTKINNVLIDDETGLGLCVIDLDTVMPGLVLDDFGDLVRTSTSFAKEDDRDLTKVGIELPIFDSLVRGYLSSAGEFLNRDEVASLVLSGKLMTFESSLRFLTDYLLGDTYFRVHREGHNLDRARVQLRLLDSIRDNADEMERLVQEAAKQMT